jgi:type VII secretion system (Wss) protein ESAT-6
MSSLKVTPAQLETLGHSTRRASAEVRGEHQQLSAQLSPLFGADWAGAAARPMPGSRRRSPPRSADAGRHRPGWPGSAVQPVG